MTQGINPKNRLNKICKLALSGLAIVIFVLAGHAVRAAPTHGYSGHQLLFGTGEVRSSNIALFPKWEGALERYFDERRLEVSSCTSSRFNRCHLSQWKVFLDGMRGKASMNKIIAVNAYMNRKRYIIDPRNYGVRDYWATPA